MTSGEWDQFAQDMVVALIAAAATAGLTGSVGSAGLVFTATLNLKLAASSGTSFSQQGRQDEMSSQLDDLNARIEAALEEQAQLRAEIERRKSEAQRQEFRLRSSCWSGSWRFPPTPDERSQIEARIAELQARI